MVKEKIKIIKQLIGQDRLEEALAELSDLIEDVPHLKDSLLNVSGQYNYLIREMIHGTVSFNDDKTERNRIRKSLLMVCSVFERDLDKGKLRSEGKTGIKKPIVKIVLYSLTIVVFSIGTLQIMNRDNGEQVIEPEVTTKSDSVKKNHSSLPKPKLIKIEDLKENSCIATKLAKVKDSKFIVSNSKNAIHFSISFEFSGTIVRESENDGHYYHGGNLEIVINKVRIPTNFEINFLGPAYRRNDLTSALKKSALSLAYDDKNCQVIYDIIISHIQDNV